MSVFAQSWAWKFNIPSVPKLVLIALADQSDDDGEVRYRDVSAEFFSQKCGMTVRNFRRHIQSLELNGYLRRAVGGGRGNGTEFALELGRMISPLAEWQQPEIHPKETDKEQAEETRTEMSGFTDEKPGQLRQETRTITVRNPDMGVRVSASIHNTRNQSTKESTSARARARGVAPRAPALSKQEKPAERFVIHLSDHWMKIKAYRERRGFMMPTFAHRGEGDQINYTGRWFPQDEWQAALDEYATGPPDDADPTDDATSTAGFEDQGGGDHDQSAACV